MAPPCHSGPHPDVVGWRSRLSSQLVAVHFGFPEHPHFLSPLQIARCATRAPETVLLSGKLAYKRYMPQYETYVHSPPTQPATVRPSALPPMLS